MDDKGNTKPQENKTTRHTWIGDEEEIRQQEEMSKRRTYTLSPQATRIVTRQKKKYSGFITDEELQNSEIIKIEDRKTQLVSKEDISQTRIYDPFGKSDETADGSSEAGPKKPVIKLPKTLTIKMTDGRRKGLIAVLVLVLLLVAFEASFFAMKSAASGLPEKTAAAKTQTEELKSENDKLKEQSELYGDAEQMKELKESWERQKEKMENSE